MTSNFYLDFTYYCGYSILDSALAILNPITDRICKSGTPHEKNFRKAYYILYKLSKQYPQYVKITTDIHPYDTGIFHKEVSTCKCPTELLTEIFHLLDINQ